MIKNRLVTFLLFSLLTIIVLSAGLVYQLFFNSSNKKEVTNEINTNVVATKENKISENIRVKNDSNNIDWNTYVNPVYRYNIQYPRDYLLEEYLSSQVLYNSITKDREWLRVELQKDYPDAQFGSVPADFIRRSMKAFSLKCESADLKGGFYVCNEVSRIKSFTNTSGIITYEVYLKKYDYLKGGKTFIGEVGPFYALDITEQTSGSARALYLFLTKNMFLNEKASPLLSDEENKMISQFINGISFPSFHKNEYADFNILNQENVIPNSFNGDILEYYCLANTYGCVSLDVLNKLEKILAMNGEQITSIYTPILPIEVGVPLPHDPSYYSNIVLLSTINIQNYQNKYENKIYTYNKVTNKFTLIYNDSGNERVLHTMGTAGSKLILRADNLFYNPSFLCSYGWIRSEVEGEAFFEFYTLDLANIKSGLKSYELPQNKINSENNRVIECVKKIL